MKRFQTLCAAGLLSAAAAILNLRPAAQAEPAPASQLEKAAVERFIARCYEQARLDFEAGRPERASRVLEAIEVLYPVSPVSPDAAALKKRCEQAIFQSRTLVGYARSDKEFYTAGEKVTITFRLRNVGRAAVCIPTRVTTKERFLLPDVVRKNNCMYVTYASMEFHAGGEMRSVEDTRSMTFEEEINLNPGEEWRRSFPFDTVKRTAADGVIQTIRVIGTFTPIFVRADEETRQYQRFLFEPVTVTVLPAGFEAHLDRDKPLDSLREGLAGGKPLAVFYASALLGGPEKMEAAALLIDALRKSEPGTIAERAVTSALGQVSGLYYGGDRELWYAWWEAERHRYEPGGGKAAAGGKEGQ